MELILYGKPGCALCDRMESMLWPHVASRPDLTIVYRDILEHDQWREAYRLRVPVLVAGDRVLLEGRPSEAQVAAAVAAVLST